MSSSSFMSSHPTGLPSIMTPVIVDQSPELGARNVFDDHDYQDALELRSELMPKSATTIQMHQAHDLGSLSYGPSSYDSAILSSATFDSARSNSQGPYPDGLTSSRPSTSDDGEEYTSIPVTGNYQVKIIEWGPREGSAGTNVQVTISSPFRINTSRALAAYFGRHETSTVCTPLGEEGISSFRYLVSFQALPQVTSQYSKQKPFTPVSLYIPLEGLDHAVNIEVGAFTYANNGTLGGRPGSGAGQKRRTSSADMDSISPTGDGHDEDGPRPSKARYGQLPPIRSGGSISQASQSESNYSNSSMHDEYHSPISDGVPGYYQQPFSGYAFSSACTPTTPTWSGSVSSNPLTLSNASNTVQLTNDTRPVSGNNPRFVRRRNDQIASISGPGIKPQGGSFNPYGMYPNHKANLRLEGELSSMTTDWSPREKQDKRRLVHFTREQINSTIHANFRPVDPDQKEPNSTLISCIWREDRNECYVTSVDTISLLESLVTPDTAFTVEEKNRIRRNLEGFHPETISKQKPENEEFFKQIMGYPPPRPRHIEKDVKVFKWTTLEVALKKIISKYCASYASTADAPRRQLGSGQFGDGGAPLHLSDLSSGGRGSISSASSYTMVPSQAHSQSMALGGTSGSFGDYGQSYSSFTPSMAARYSHYSNPTGYGVQGNAAGMMQQHHHSNRQGVGFSHDWTNPF